MPEGETDQQRQNADALRRLIDESLLQSPPSDAGPFFDNLYAQARARRLQWDASIVLEHWWWLARLGVLAFPGKLPMTARGEIGIPHVLLTSRGRKLLEHGEQSPHNPQRYCRTIEERIKTPDDIVMLYLNEAIGAWAAGLYHAAAVMLGCACERLILLLAEAISDTAILPSSSRLKKDLSKSDNVPVSISQIFKKVRGHSILPLFGRENHA